MSTIQPQKTGPAYASPETLRGDWLARLRLAVDFNLELDRIIDEAEGRHAA